MGTLNLRTSGTKSSGSSGSSSSLYNDPGHSAANSSSMGYNYNGPSAADVLAGIQSFGGTQPQITDPRMKVHGEEVRGRDILGLHGREMRQAGRARFDQSSALGTLGGGMGPQVYVPPSATGPGALGPGGFGDDNPPMGPIMRAPRVAPADVTNVAGALASGKRANKKFLGI